MDGADAAGEQELLAINQLWFERATAKDLDRLMSHIADEIVSYEHDEPLQHIGL